jgi:hypothetical protein
MARSLEAKATLQVKEDGQRRDAHTASSTIADLTHLFHTVLTLNTNTQNYQVNFGSGFSTPTHMLIREQSGRTLTYSVNATTHHHPIAAYGYIASHSRIASLYLSVSSSPSTRPKVEIILAR